MVILSELRFLLVPFSSSTLSHKLLCRRLDNPFFVIFCGRCRNEPSEGLQRKSWDGNQSALQQRRDHAGISQCCQWRCHGNQPPRFGVIWRAQWEGRNKSKYFKSVSEAQNVHDKLLFFITRKVGNKTMKFMFSRTSMFWYRIRLILACWGTSATWKVLKHEAVKYGKEKQLR